MNKKELEQEVRARADRMAEIYIANGALPSVICGIIPEPGNTMRSIAFGFHGQDLSEVLYILEDTVRRLKNPEFIKRHRP